MIQPTGRLLFANPRDAVQVACVAAAVCCYQHLHQRRGEIERVCRHGTVGDLLESCALAVVTGAPRQACAADVCELIRLIAAGPARFLRDSVSLRAIADQITVVIPGIGLTVHTRQAIDGIILIRGHDRRGDRRRLRGAIADGVIGIRKGGGERAGLPSER